MYVPEDETKLAVIENREKAREARQRGDWDDAEEFLRESRRAFYRAHGKRDRLRETALRELPLGGFLDRHRHETFLQADAIYLNDLGELALKRDRADLEAAESYFRRSLDLSRETGFRNGEALSLANLGRIESRRGASETACEHFQSAAEIFRGTGSVPDALDTIEGLIETCGDGENQRVAREWCRIAIALALETGLDEAAREFVDLREQL